MSDVASPLTRAEQRRAANIRAYREVGRPLRYSVAQAAAALDCSPLYVYELIKKGLIRAQGTKRKLWITALSLERYVEDQPAYTPSASTEQSAA